MNCTRRLVLFGTTAGVLSTISLDTVFGQSPRIPNPATFQSGDFVWPKKPGAFVPYRYESGQSADEDRERWFSERAQFLAMIRRGEVPGGEQIAPQVQNLSYNDFRTRYLRNQEPNQIVPYSLGGVAAVGHVAIIELDSEGMPWVIEALWNPGVVRQRYQDWITARFGEIVWHGRLKGAGQQERSKIALEAKNYISKPYNFWNFNLADVSGFYCSKLVWLAIMRSLTIAVDGNPNPNRLFWLSPKQLLYADKIDRLFDPGEYATD